MKSVIMYQNSPWKKNRRKLINNINKIVNWKNIVGQEFTPLPIKLLNEQNKKIELKGI